MNKFAVRSTEYAIKKLYDFSRTNVRLHDIGNIPKGSIVFVVNHFTRIETIFLPFHIHKTTGVPVWSLADASIFKGIIGEFISHAGALSTDDPDRDKVMVKSLLTGEANWIIFPEGVMVKNKKLIHQGEFMLELQTGRKKPHTGAATLGLRTEFYRERLRYLNTHNPDEAKRLQSLFEIDDLDPVLFGVTYIVPVNLTYYPIRSRNNILSKLAGNFVTNPSERMLEELVTEGSMILSGVDVDVRFGEPIKIRPYMKQPVIQWDISSDQSIDFNDNINSKTELRKAAANITHGYMASIYDMTMINHDHLFASMLCGIKENVIRVSDLKNRVYLATVFNIDKKKIYHHDGLLKNQIHLLTDDRFRKFENFIQFAIDKDLIDYDKEAGIVEKKADKFDEKKYDFHTIRLQNPLAVMVNEIEPLGDFLFHLRRLALDTDFHITRRLTGYLLEKAVSCFKKDYDSSFSETESMKYHYGMPYLLNGTDKKAGVLLVHGYLATPYEMKTLADYLQNIGYYVYVPRLPGHGTTPEDLAEQTYEQWIYTVEEGYVMLENMCDTVLVGGFSTGAGLALDLCTRVKNIAGVFAIGSPATLKDFTINTGVMADIWKKLILKFTRKDAKKEFFDYLPEKAEYYYTKTPVSGLKELDKFMDSYEKKLEQITTPALVLHSRIDPVVDPCGAKKIFDKIGSEIKEYYACNLEKHCIINDPKDQRIFRAIGDFAEMCLKMNRSG